MKIRRSIDEAVYLTKKASLALSGSRFSEAEQLVLEAIKIFGKVYKESPYYAETLMVYSDILFRQDKIREARAVAETSYGLVCVSLGEKCLNAIRMRASIGVLCMGLKDFKEAEKCFMEALEYFSDPFYIYKADHINTLSNLFQLYWRRQDFEKSDNALVEVIASLKRYYSSIMKQWDESERLAFYDTTYKLNLMVYNYIIERCAANPIILKDIFEFRLFSKGLLLKEFESKGLHRSYGDIQEKLKENEAAVEIIRFNYIDKFIQDKAFYFFIIITKETKDHPYATYYWCDHESEVRRFDIYTSSIKRKSIDLESYNYLWQGLEEFLSGKSTIYISPDGFYRHINLNSLFTPRGKFLIEEREIIYVNDFNSFDTDLSVQVLARKATLPGRATLLGNPDFGQEASSVYPKLIDSEAEIRAIEKLLKGDSWLVATYLGTDANKENLLNSLPSEVLHIATHGFFKHKNDPITEMDDMLECSGILLSNTDIQRNPEKSGVLTAKEIRSLDLSKVRLVVLSACHTGIGRLILTGDSFGLQRAFLNAGVKALIVSLDKVPDQATKELMTEFYSNWLVSGNINRAFREAQLCLKDRYRHPFYWGGFIMINS